MNARRRVKRSSISASDRSWVAAGGQILQFAPEFGDVVKIQAPQGDPQPVFSGSERQFGEDGVDRQEPVLDVFDGGIKGAIEWDEILSAPFRQPTAPFLAAFVQAGSGDVVEDVAVAAVGLDGHAEVRVRPPSLVGLKNSAQRSRGCLCLVSRGPGVFCQSIAEASDAVREVVEVVGVADGCERDG